MVPLGVFCLTVHKITIIIVSIINQYAVQLCILSGPLLSQRYHRPLIIHWRRPPSRQRFTVSEQPQSTFMKYTGECESAHNWRYRGIHRKRHKHNRSNDDTDSVSQHDRIQWAAVTLTEMCPTSSTATQCHGS